MIKMIILLIKIFDKNKNLKAKKEIFKKMIQMSNNKMIIKI